MDYMLDIILLRGELDKIKLRESLMEWGGEVYSSSPAIYVSDSEIEFFEVKDFSFYDRYLDLKDKNNLIGLHLKSDILYDFQLFANNKIKKLDENALLDFLKSLFSLSKFYIILTREDELIKEKYKISDLKEFELILLKSLNWLSPKDVLLYKD